ncbi:DUF2177 family protein [Ornithinimicrobium panacihumi]|uniref:DUF2177 family protein n=1 Tax=Ornithinimicrobium panacihumi TaxID=2008449 RepID=UPI003F898445
MRPARWLGGWAAGAAVFGALDALWLGVVAKDFNQRALGPLMADPLNVPAAAAFYGIYTLGIAHFATAPGLREGSVGKAAAQGAALGLVAYSTYDLTSLAVIEDFPAEMVVPDIAWGTFVTAASAAAATAVVKAATRD